MNIRGKAALITGASRGLGRALAEALAGRGARLVLVAREWAGLDEVTGLIRAQGGEAHAIAADVGNGAASSLAAQAAALVGPIDILVHNASDLGAVPLPLLLDMEEADFLRAFAVNVVGPFAISKAIVGPMVLRGDGVVVHISSDAAVQAYPRWGAYGASKAALDHLNRTWAGELEGTGLRFVSIDPGEMDTRMHADAIPDADRADLARPSDVARRIIDIVQDPSRAASGVRVIA